MVAVKKPLWTNNSYQASKIGEHCFVKDSNTAATWLLVDEHEEAVGSTASGGVAMQVTSVFSVYDTATGVLKAKWTARTKPPYSTSVFPGGVGPAVGIRPPAFRVHSSSDQGIVQLVMPYRAGLAANPRFRMSRLVFCRRCSKLTIHTDQMKIILGNVLFGIGLICVFIAFMSGRATFIGLGVALLISALPIGCFTREVLGDSIGFRCRNDHRECPPNEEEAIA